jgi:Ca2+/H+ antiporter
MNNLLLSLMVLHASLVDRVKGRRDAGQGSLEYVGMIAVAAIIIAAVAVVATAAGPQIGAFINTAIAKVQAAVGK